MCQKPRSHGTLISMLILCSNTIWIWFSYKHIFHRPWLEIHLTWALFEWIKSLLNSSTFGTSARSPDSTFGTSARSPDSTSGTNTVAMHTELNIIVLHFMDTMTVWSLLQTFAESPLSFTILHRWTFCPFVFYFSVWIHLGVLKNNLAFAGFSTQQAKSWLTLYIIHVVLNYRLLD